MAARANSLTVDRADIRCAVKETCRGMSKRVKRPARYLKGAKAATVVGSSNPEAVRNIVVNVDKCGRDAREVMEFDSSHCGDLER